MLGCIKTQTASADYYVGLRRSSVLYFTSFEAGPQFVIITGTRRNSHKSLLLTSCAACRHTDCRQNVGVTWGSRPRPYVTAECCGHRRNYCHEGKQQQNVGYLSLEHLPPGTLSPPPKSPWRRLSVPNPNPNLAVNANRNNRNHNHNANYVPNNLTVTPNTSPVTLKPTQLADVGDGCFLGGRCPGRGQMSGPDTSSSSRVPNDDVIAT